MAVVVRSRDLMISRTAGLLQPIIYCKSDTEIACASSLNLLLAEKLMMVKPNRRTMRLEQCFQQVLDCLPDNPVIRDFDVLFNPDYEVDILILIYNEN